MSWRERLAGLRRNGLARVTVWVLGGQAARAVLQALYFLLVARALHAEGFGAFVAVLAVISVVSPMAGWGAANILVRKIAAAPAQLRDHLGEAVGLALVGAGLGSGVAFAAAKWMLPAGTSTLVVVLLILAELWFGRVFEMAEKLFLATEDGRRGSSIWVVVTGLKVLAAGGMWLLYRAPSVVDWAELYLACNLVAAVTLASSVIRQHGWPRVRFTHVWRECGEGFLFAFSLVAQNTYNDIDKTLLSRFGSLEATGFYAAAYRIINVAFTPISAFLYAAYAHFFRRGVNGAGPAVQLARKSVKGALLYSTAACVALNLTAPLIPLLFGPTFRPTIEAVRILSLLPILKSLHYLAGDALSGAGLQSRRVMAQAVVAVGSIPLSIAGIRLASWRGAAVASLIADAMLALLLWTVALRAARRVPGDLADAALGSRPSA